MTQTYILHCFVFSGNQRVEPELLIFISIEKNDICKMSNSSCRCVQVNLNLFFHSLHFLINESYRNFDSLPAGSHYRPKYNR